MPCWAGVVLRASENPALMARVGDDIVTASGTTLLGAASARELASSLADLMRPVPPEAWDDLEALMKGPEPRPDWVVTSSGAIDTELGVLKTGKEADVFLVEREDPHRPETSIPGKIGGRALIELRATCLLRGMRNALPDEGGPPAGNRRFQRRHPRPARDHRAGLPHFLGEQGGVVRACGRSAAARPVQARHARPFGRGAAPVTGPLTGKPA
mgnify:CR=1 FL=1